MIDNRTLRTCFREILLSGGVKLGALRNGQSELEALLTRNTNLLAHIPKRSRGESCAVIAEVSGQRDCNRNDHFVFVAKINEIGLVER